MSDQHLIKATERYICARKLYNMRHCMCPDCAESSMEDFEMTEPDENGYRYIRMTDFAFERMTAGFVGRALTLLNVEASNAAHPTPETRWHGHRLQQKWTNGAGEFEWCDIAETEETMERE